MKCVGARLWVVLCMVVGLTLPPSAILWAADPPPKPAEAMTPPPEPEKRGILGDRFSLDAGLKIWVAKWQPAGFVNGINSTRTSDTTAMLGPSITGTVRLRNDETFNALSVNFTWLEAGGFDFTPFGYNNGGSGPPTDKTSAIRRDYSIVAALSVWRGFGLFAGYYNMQQRFNSTYPGAITGPPYETVYISGPLIGFFGSGTVAGPLKAYGNLAIGFYDEKSNNNPSNTVQTTAKGVQGYSSEFGLSLDGPSLKTGAGSIGSALQVGFRAQIINVNNNGLANNDVTWGPTFQVVARF